MLIEADWDIFKAKFKNPKDNFEWLCYLLFSKEYNQPYGTHRYKNQSGIETDPIQVGDEVIGWQSKFYEDTLSKNKDDLLGTLTKTKRDNPNITKIILYTNSEWGQGQGTKEPKAKTETEEKAKELEIELVWRVKSYFESPFVCQEQKDISRYFFEQNTKWELSNLGFKDTLRYCYLKNFKNISLLLDKPKRIKEIFVNVSIIKEEDKNKDEDSKKIPERQTYDINWESIHKPKEPIDVRELIQKSKKSLIYGKAGIGKTTLCKYIAYMWAKGNFYQEFEYVVYIPLRKWNSTQLKEVIRSYYYSQYKEEVTLDIKENRDKILFLFDGYDELKSDKRDGLHEAIRDNNLTHYIITTRPYGYQKSDFRVDKQFETIGFTDENVEKYIEAFFKDNSEKSKGLKKFLQTNISIRHIAYIPLMLEMICSLWQEKEFSNSLTMTELYTQSIENIFFEYTEKNGTAYIQDKEEEIFDYLGKIAFEGLKQQTIILDKSITKITTRDFFLNYVLKAGFLNGEDLNKSNPFLNNYQFPHLTFQEYFSALYVSKLSPNEQSEIIRDWKFYPHMQMFFAFLGGLIEDKEFFLEELLSTNNNILIYNRAYMCMLILDCLQNIKKDELSKEKIELIEQGILRELGRTLDYPFFLEKLKLASSFISDTLVNHFIEDINNDENTIKFRKDLTIFLFSLGRYDESIKSAFIEILKHPKWKEELILFHESKIIDELLSLGNNDIQNIDICLTIIEKHQNFNTSIKIIEKLLNKYNDHKDKIMSCSIKWLQKTTQYPENYIMENILDSYTYSYYNEYKTFFSLLKNRDDFIDYYIELLKEDITIERKISIAIFLYFMNKHSSKINPKTILEVTEIMYANPLELFCSIAKNYSRNLFNFIKEDEEKNTNFFNTLIALLEDKKISLSFKNSHQMLKILIDRIGASGSALGDTKELDKKLLDFIIKYYIENEDIDLDYRKYFFKPSIFCVVQDSNKTVKKFLKEYHPTYLNENHSVYNNQNKTIEKVEKNLPDVLKDKNISSNELTNAIKDNWNIDDFLISIQNKDIELKNKKTMIEAVIQSHYTQNNLITLLIEMIKDENIELAVRRHIAKTLYEKGVDSDELIDRLIEFIKETDLEFIVKVNPQVKRSNEIIDVLTEKIDRYGDIISKLEWYRRNDSFPKFLNNEKVVNLLFKLIRHPLISSHDKRDVLRLFKNSVTYQNIPTEKFIDTILGYIEDKGEAFGAKTSDNDCDGSVLYHLISPLKKINNLKVYNALKELLKKEDVFSEYAWGIVVNLLAKSPNPDNFLEDKEIDEKSKLSFSRTCPTESLLKAYKTKYESMVVYIVDHLHYKKLPLYIKDDKKLYTISNGEEISTEKINENILNKILKIKQPSKER